MLQKKNPTVLIINEESSLYILFFNSMILIQEVFFVYSRNEITNDIKVRQNSANTQTIAKTVYFKRHSAFSLRRDYAIIAMECICCIDGGEVINRPPENERK